MTRRLELYERNQCTNLINAATAAIANIEAVISFVIPPPPGTRHELTQEEKDAIQELHDIISENNRILAADNELIEQENQRNLRRVR